MTTPKKTPDTSRVTRSRSQQSAGTGAPAPSTSTQKRTRGHDQHNWWDPTDKNALAMIEALAACKTDESLRTRGYEGIRKFFPGIGEHGDAATKKAWGDKRGKPKCWDDAERILARLARNPLPGQAPPAPLGGVQHGTLSGLHLDAAAGAAGNAFSTLSISEGGDGVNRRLFSDGGAATGGRGGELKTTGLVASDMDPGVGGGGGAGMMGQYQYQHQLGGAASGLGGGRGRGWKTTGLDDGGAGTVARGAGGAMAHQYGDGAAALAPGGGCRYGRTTPGTPVRHHHIVEASPHILSPEQKVAMEQAKAERAVAEAEAAKDRKERAVAEAEAAKDRKVIATALATLSVTVVQHTGQIGDLQEGQDLHASQIGDLQGGQKTLQDRVEKLEIQGQTSAQLADESIQHQTELKNYVDVGQTQLKNYVEMHLGPLPPNGNN